MFNIITNLKTTYLHSFSQYKTDDEFKLLCQNWYRFFKNDDYTLVSKAVDNFIANDTTGYVPTIGQIKNEMFKFYKNSQTDVNDAWQLVLRNAKCDYAAAKKNYDALPLNIQKVISPAFLSELGYATHEQVGYKRNEFERKYNAVLERGKELLLSGEISVDQLGMNNTEPQRLETGLKSIKELIGGSYE